MRKNNKDCLVKVATILLLVFSVAILLVYINSVTNSVKDPSISNGQMWMMFFKNSKLFILLDVASIVLLIHANSNSNNNSKNE